MKYLTDLGFHGRKIYQDTDGYAFSQDSVFLANFASLYPSDAVIDLGCGCGILLILALLKKGVKRGVGIETDEFAAALAKENIALNALDDRAEIICADVKNIREFIARESFDKALCNPPYFDKSPTDCADNAANIQRLNSRHYCDCSLDDFVYAAERALKFGGDLYIVYKAERICDLLCSLRAHRLEPKHMIFLRPKNNLPVDTVIVKARKGAKPSCTNEIITVHNDDGSYTDRIKELY